MTTADALRLSRAMRVSVDATVDTATRDLVAAWESAWAEVSGEWSHALDDLIRTGDGGWPSRWQITRAQRAQAAMRASVAALNDLAKVSGVRILRDVSALAAEADVWVERIARAQAPGVDLGVDWARLDDRALGAIVKRTTQQVEAATWRLPREQAAVMKQTLIRGVSVGDNPRDAAAEMLRRLGGAFDGGRARAENLARTEMLDAHRAAARLSRMQHPDVIEGWQWTSTLSPRTCPACLAMHGKIFPADHPGPEGHQSCRCTASPVVRSLSSILGMGIPEPADVMPDARAWFDAQPDSVQERIMGAERLRRLRAGELAWDDIPTVRTTRGWRDSIGVRPLAA